MNEDTKRIMIKANQLRDFMATLVEGESIASAKGILFIAQNRIEALWGSQTVAIALQDHDLIARFNSEPYEGMGNLNN